MYVYVCLCVYMCIYVYVCLCVYIYIYTCVYIYIYRERERERVLRGPDGVEAPLQRPLQGNLRGVDDVAMQVARLEAGGQDEQPHLPRDHVVGALPVGLSRRLARLQDHGVLGQTLHRGLPARVERHLQELRGRAEADVGVRHATLLRLFYHQYHHN